eukprot:GHVN01066229.1.p2 GENE.GHVN01066229.1~~GHVN01066229.1.p2  ORF type:complete len:129 (+),score=0.42 GHVN01066229.1:1299-1685(+)
MIRVMITNPDFRENVLERSLEGKFVRNVFIHFVEDIIFNLYGNRYKLVEDICDDAKTLLISLEKDISEYEMLKTFEEIDQEKRNTDKIINFLKNTMYTDKDTSLNISIKKVIVYILKSCKYFTTPFQI